MLYREIIAVCSEIHTKHINTLCGQNVELLFFKLVVHIVTTVGYIMTAGGAYSNQCAVHILTTGGTYSDYFAVHIVTIVQYI